MDFLRWPFRWQGGTGPGRPGRRRCILHVGSPKTATSTIQFVLKENRKQLLKDGVLVPRSGQTETGSHRYLAFSLAGMPVPAEAGSADLELAREIARSDAGCVVISSEFFWTILARKQRANRVMGYLTSLGLDVSVVLYVRNQPQYINSFYQHNANFRRDCAFPSFVGEARRNSRMYTYSRWVGFAERHGVRLLARPFSDEVRKRGVVGDFLATAGVSPAGRYNNAVELRRSIGPFTVAAARALMQRTGDPKRLTERQTSECRHALRSELRRRGIEDHGYCGLTTGLAAEIEQAFAKDNARFAEAVWGKPWREVFACDAGRDFEPNDYAMTGVPADRRQLLEEVLATLGPRIEAIAKPRGSRMLSALKSRFPL